MSNKTSILAVASVAILMFAALFGAIAVATSSNNSDSGVHNHNNIADRFSSFSADSDSTYDVRIRTTTATVHEKADSSSFIKEKSEKTVKEETVAANEEFPAEQEAAAVEEAFADADVEEFCEVVWHCETCGAEFVVTPGQELWTYNGNYIFSCEESQVYYDEQVAKMTETDDEASFDMTACISYTLPEQYVGYEQYYYCNDCGSQFLIQPGVDFYFMGSCVYTSEETQAMYDEVIAAASEQAAEQNYLGDLIDEKLLTEVDLKIYETDKLIGSAK